MADYIIGGILVALAIWHCAASSKKHLPAVVPAAAAVMAADPAVTDRIRKLPPNKRWNGRRLRHRSLADY